MNNQAQSVKTLAAELVVLTAFLAGSSLVATLPELVERSRLSALGSADVAAATVLLGLATVPMTFAQSILAFAVTPIAKAAGAGDGRLSSRLGVQTIWLALLGGGAFLALAAGIELLGGRREELLYLKYVLCTWPPLLLVGAVSAWLTAQRAGAAVLAIHGLLGLLQIALCTTRIPMGGLIAAGEARLLAAGATALASIFIMGLSRAFRSSCTWRNLRPDWRLMQEVLRGGTANAVTLCLMSCVPAGFLFLLRQTSIDDAAAVGVGLAVYSVVFSASLGFSQAVQAVISRRLGEGRPDLLILNARLGLFMVLPLAAGAALLLWTAPAGLLRLACGTRWQWQTMQASLPLVLVFLGFHVFGDALCTTFAAALRSINQFRSLCLTTLILGTACLAAACLAVQVGARLPVFLALLCLYTTGQGILSLLCFKRLARQAVPV